MDTFTRRRIRHVQARLPGRPDLLGRQTSDVAYRSLVIWREVRAILARRDFRTLLYTRLTGQFADGLLQAALATFVLFSPERQTTPEGIAAAFAVLLLPYSLIGPFAGLLLDRWRRRTVLVRANWLRAISVLTLIFYVANDQADLQLGIAVLITVGLGRFVLAGLSASLPHVVQQRQLMTANSFKPTAGTIAYALGALAGVLVGNLVGGGDNGSLVVLALTLVTYAIAGLWPLRLPAAALGPDRGAATDNVGAVVRGLAAGAVALARTNAAWRSLVIVLVNRIIFGALTVLLLLVLRNVIHPPDQPDAALGDFALIASGVTLGAFLAALLTPRLGRVLGPVQWACLVATIAGLVVTPTLFTLAVLPILLVSPLVGLSNQSAKICSDSILQHRIPDEELGRVFAIVDMTVNVGLVIGVTLVAFLAPADGVSSLGFLALGVAYLSVAAWYYLTRDRSLETDPIFESVR